MNDTFANAVGFNKEEYQTSRFATKRFPKRGEAMKLFLICVLLAAGALFVGFTAQSGAPANDNPRLGLPPVPIPEDNPQTADKIALGKKLFEDKRFSSTGDVSCATCHEEAKAFTDSPLKVSEGINKLKGTRNAPTVLNAVYMKTMFWDGRSPDLEDQALHPFINPVEQALQDHEPILEIVRTDPEYVKAFESVFGKTGDNITMREVTMAIAAFEREQVFGNSPFDRWYYGGDGGALTSSQKRGFELFTNEGRCVSCHVVEQTQALFTDNRFHNIGVGINNIQKDIPALAGEFIRAEATASEVDVKVLTDKKSSELGRFALTRTFNDLGSFKTPTLRNIALTAPYMHDGSLATLRDVVVHYNNGGVTNEGDPVNDFLSGGIRPLELTDDEIDDLVAFMEALTSDELAHLAQKADKK
jgi:cytochrome c peroxidase